MRHRKEKRSKSRSQEGSAGRNVQTTLRLPRPLYEQAKIFAAAGTSSSVNDLIVRALSAYVKAMERRAIDEAFRPMAKDASYQREAVRVAEQFAASDADTLLLSERDLAEA